MTVLNQVALVLGGSRDRARRGFDFVFVASVTWGHAGSSAAILSGSTVSN